MSVAVAVTAVAAAAAAAAPMSAHGNTLMRLMLRIYIVNRADKIRDCDFLCGSCVCFSQTDIQFCMIESFSVGRSLCVRVNIVFMCMRKII